MMINDTAQSLDSVHALFAGNLQGKAFGLTAVCSAHPLVLRAALMAAHKMGQIALVEATCNQVNQEGGYTGMQPADFVRLVLTAADEEGVPRNRIVLGGDHLGPQPWRNQSADIAMAKAEAMVAAYVRAGFVKIHLDCSMRCDDDPEILSEDTIAKRAARLAVVAEGAATSTRPIYVIGTEVPPPGGMGEGHAITATNPDHVATTWEAHRAAFEAVGMTDAFSRVSGIVVQPGLDFGNETVVHFDANAAQCLSAKAANLNGAVFEAHSTDYQRPAAYMGLVRGHFAILKVGPAVTFALREAVYALQSLASEVLGETAPDVRGALERAMLDDPRHWNGHYAGDDIHLAWLRHFSWSDRIRYYWTVPAVQSAVSDLFERLDAVQWPLPLVSQYLPRQFDAIADLQLSARCETVVKDFIAKALTPYLGASEQHPQTEQES